jgi:hypothetical protein
VECGYPASENETKAHGLQDSVPPIYTHSVINMEKSEADEVSRELLAMKELCGEEDGGQPITWMVRP